ncbi:MAG: FtsX-like permease family protein, partial [Thermomicrobiales bacterium]
MTLWTLAARSLRYYWRPQLAVLFAVVVATAALTGALLVGDSMRASLRRQAFDRIGRFSHVILAPRNVRQSFVTRLAHQQTLQSELITPCPILLSPCGVSEPNSHRRVDQAQVLGVTRDFWIQGENAKHKDFQEEIPPNHAVLTQTLADELGVGIGDDVVLRVGKPAEVSTDSILGRREERITQTRLTVKKVIPAKGVATFSLNLQHAPPKNIFVALETLQQTLGVKNRVNAVLLAPGVNARNRKGIPETLPSNSTRLEDVGLRLRVDEERRYVSLENESFLIPTDVAHAAQALAPSDDLEASPLIAYLANEITNITSLASSQPVRGVLPAIPYSTVAAINGAGVVLSQFEPAESKESLTLQTGQILLNGVAAERLSANVGDRIRLSYYTTGALGELDEQTAEFTVSGVVALAGAAADSGFVPEYPGITDAKSLMDWDPPFPVDLKKIMDADEAYWDEYRATPKAYVSLTDGERLWSSEATTLGTYTSIRFYPTNNEPISALADKFRETLNAELSPSDLGIEYRDLHAEFAAGAKGSTDFSGLFIGFSFFLIAAAAGLIALLFRLGIERRAGEVGLLSALGYSHKSVRNLLLSEGAIVAATGSVIGVVGAIFYAWLMLEGLRNWWSAAVNAPFLRLSISPMTLIIGLVSGILLALATIWWSLRDLAKHSPRALLSGNMSLKQVEQKTRFPVASTIFFGALVAGLGILATAL